MPSITGVGMYGFRGLGVGRYENACRETPALRMKRSDWDVVLTTDLTGSFLCIQLILYPKSRAPSVSSPKALHRRH